MKITKQQLKQIIKEEVESLPIDNLIGGINGLVQGMDPELVGVVFTTVFKDIENGGSGPEPEATGEPEEITPIGFGREPEQLSDKEPGQIGFEESLKAVIEEEMRSDPELVNSIDKLTKSIERLDISIDYLSSAVTDEDPLAMNLMQKGFGRMARPGSKSDKSLDELGTNPRLSPKGENTSQEIYDELRDVIGCAIEEWKGKGWTYDDINSGIKSAITKIFMSGGRDVSCPDSELTMAAETKGDIPFKKLKKGRCTPMGTEECPEGSPQYNLAKAFKGKIRRSNLKRGKNPHGPGE